MNFELFFRFFHRRIMTQFLPPNLLALFAPRESIPYLPPTDKLPHEKKRLPYGGLIDFAEKFEVIFDDSISMIIDLF